MKPYPLSKTQTTVLKALNLKASDFSEAEKIFSDLGIVVTSKRQGRTSVPVIQVLDRQSGGFNADGEGFIFTKYPDIDASAISQWIE